MEDINNIVFSVHSEFDNDSDKMALKVYFAYIRNKSLVFDDSIDITNYQELRNDFKEKCNLIRSLIETKFSNTDFSKDLFYFTELGR